MKTKICRLDLITSSVRFARVQRYPFVAVFAAKDIADSRTRGVLKTKILLQKLKNACQVKPKRIITTRIPTSPNGIKNKKYLKSIINLQGIQQQLSFPERRQPFRLKLFWSHPNDGFLNRSPDLPIADLPE